LGSDFAFAFALAESTVAKSITKQVAAAAIWIIRREIQVFMTLSFPEF
jgi:hypothetical protein